MDIKDLPKVGPGFKASLNKPGTPSLQKSLGRLAIKNSAFRNLSKGNIGTIVKAIKPAEKAIRLKGGMSRYQVKSATKKIWKAYNTTKGTEDAFSKQDVQDAKEVLATYKKSADQQKKNDVKKAIPFRPYLNQEQAPKLGMGSITEMNQHLGSVTSLTDRNIGSIKTENTHNVASVTSLTNPTHSVSSVQISRPNSLLGRIGGMFGSSKGLGGLPSSGLAKPTSTPRLKF